MSTSSFSLRNFLKIQIILPVLSSLILVAILTHSAYSAFFFVLGIAIVLSLVHRPALAISILIIILPFHDTPFFRTPVMGFKGSEPFYLFSFFVILIGLLNAGKSHKMDKLSVFLSLFVITIFAWSVVRSIPNMENINQRFIAEGRDRLTLLPYILKIFVRPSLNFVPFILILKYLKSEKEIDYLFNIICFSVMLFTFYLFSIFIFIHPNISDAGAVNTTLMQYAGMQRNGVATIYELAFPFMLARFFLKKNIFNFILLLLCLAIIAYSYSRTGYVVVFLGIIAYIFLSKRTKYLPMLSILVFGLVLTLSQSIYQRVSHGFQTEDLNEISSGRTGNLWEPLIKEYLANPPKLILGNGRFSIVSSESVSRGLTPDSMLHPHNMYLEQIFDAGLIAFFLIISISFFVIRRIWRSLGTIKSERLKEYQIAIFISVGSYLMAGMTALTLFPSSLNNYFWISLALGLIISKVSLGNQDINKTFSKSNIF